MNVGVVQDTPVSSSRDTSTAACLTIPAIFLGPRLERRRTCALFYLTGHKYDWVLETPSIVSIQGQYVARSAAACPGRYRGYHQHEVGFFLMIYVE